MEMNEMLLQMAYMAAQMSQAAALPQVNNRVDRQEGNKSTFQDLLDEKKAQAVQKPEGQPAAEGQEKPAQEVEADDAAVLQAAALMQPMVVQPAAPVVTTEEVSPAVEPLLADPQAAVPAAVPEEVAQTPTAAPQTVPQAAETPETLAPMAPAAAQTAEPAGTETPVPTEQAVAPAAAQSAEQAQPVAQTQSHPDEGEAQYAAADDQSTAKKSEVEVLEAQTGAVSQPVFQETEAMPQRVGDTYKLDTQDPEMDVKLAKDLADAFRQGEQRVELKLTPEHLGTVVVEMSRSPEGVLHVVLHTENEQAAKLLTEHSNSLGLMLQSSQQSEVRVEVQRPNQNEQPWQQPDQNGGQNGQNGRERQDQDQQAPDPERFLQQLRLGLIPVEV